MMPLSLVLPPASPRTYSWPHTNRDSLEPQGQLAGDGHGLGPVPRKVQGRGYAGSVPCRCSSCFLPENPSPIRKGHRDLGPFGLHSASLLLYAEPSPPLGLPLVARAAPAVSVSLFTHTFAHWQGCIPQERRTQPAFKPSCNTQRSIATRKKLERACMHMR